MDELIRRLAAGEAKAATELITLGERGSDVSAALPALAEAVGSPNLPLAKEAVWALYVVTWQGHSLGDARAALAAAAKRGIGNAHLGLALDDLNAGKVDVTLARMDERDDANEQFGVALALTDFCERTKDRALFERVLFKLPFGIVAPMLSNGVAASIIAQVQRGGGSFTGQALDEVANAQTDDVTAAPLFGVLLKIRERLGR